MSVFKSLKSHFSKAIHALSFAKKDFIVSKREFARVVKAPFERAFSISNIKAGFAKCGIHPFDPKAIDQSKIMQPLQGSSSSTESDLSSTNIGTPSLDTSAEPSSPMLSVNPSPIVSSLSSHIDDGFSSPQVSSPFLCTSTPVTLSNEPVTPAASLSQAVTPSTQQSTPLSRPQVVNPLVRAGLIPTHLADILSLQTDVAEKQSRRIKGVRVLTSNEYTEMMRERDKKEKEAAELKQKRKEEREKKRFEREQEKERKRKEREDKNKEGNNRKGKGKKRTHSSSEDDDEGVRVAHVQSGLLLGMKVRVMPIVRQATQCASSAMQGIPPFQQQWCFGLIVTCVENGHTHTVLWGTILPHGSLFVHRVQLELFLFLFIMFSCSSCFYKSHLVVL